MASLTLMQRAAAMAARVSARAAGGVVVYYHGEAGIEIAGAARGRTQYAAETSDGGAMLVRTDRDYLFALSALTYWGVAAPTKGDLIVDGAETYEVLPLPDKQCWRKCSEHGDLIRVHTKLVSK
jgi:hypothetical protein